MQSPEWPPVISSSDDRTGRKPDLNCGTGQEHGHQELEPAPRTQETGIRKTELESGKEYGQQSRAGTWSQEQGRNMEMGLENKKCQVWYSKG